MDKVITDTNTVGMDRAGMDKAAMNIVDIDTVGLK